MKKALALLLALVMTLALAACGGGGDDKPADNSNTQTDARPQHPGSRSRGTCRREDRHQRHRLSVRPEHQQVVG